MAAGVVKGILGNSLGLLPGNDFEPLHHSWDTLVLQTTVLSLCVLPYHHYVYVFVPGKERVRGVSEEFESQVRGQE